MPPLPARKPKPKRPDTPEGRFYAQLDSAIAPVRGYDLTRGDARALVDTLKAIKAGKLETARRLQAKIKDAVARKLADWYRLRAGFGRPAEYLAFLTNNPAWPDEKRLGKRAEEQVFVSGGSASSIKAYFKARPARTAAGFASLASAYLAQGNEARAREFAVKAWRDLSLASTLETGFLRRFGKLLSPADHKWRVDRLLLGDRRWRGARRARAAKVRRMLPLLGSAAERKKVRARLAVYLRSRNAAKRMAALRAARTSGASAGSFVDPCIDSTGGAARELITDWGLQFQRAQLLRRRKKYEKAREILLAAPKDAATLVAPDGWWAERRYAIVEAMNSGKVRIAYALAANPGPLSANPVKDAAFLAGWLALRHLHDAKAAAGHFKAMLAAADGPLSASKAAYWLGRALEAGGDKAGGARAYREAASITHSFHGQLARQTIEPGASRLTINVPALPSAERIARFNDLDAVKAITIAVKAGLRRSIGRAFFRHLRYHFKDEAGRILLAHLAQSFGDTQMALRIGKTGVANKQNLFYYAYPVDRLPAYQPLREPPETAFLLAVARQESEFNGTIKSGAGARGILQVMPITARHICRDYKIRCAIRRLVTDQSYNTMIASAYIADRMDEFGGSYVLTLTGYNAGPGRTRQWLKKFGDPRSAGYDTIDWIERVPFRETRRYVMKVLSNLQVYRARLGAPLSALQLRADLARAKTGLRDAALRPPGAPARPDTPSN